MSTVPGALRIVFFLTLSACATPQLESPEATPAPVAAPEAPVMAEPLAPSKMEESDHLYALYLEKILDEMRDGRYERLLLDYVRYLHYGDEKYAKAYVDGLLATAGTRESPVPNIDIFEGAYILCQFEGERCVKTLGALTQTYLVPRLKNGEAASLEIFVVHGAAADLDGVEEEAYRTLAESAELKTHASLLKSLKKRHAKALAKIQ